MDLEVTGLTSHNGTIMGQKGLTLIELLITITILMILASVAMPLSFMAVKRAKETELRQNLRAMRGAIDDYKKAWDQGKVKKNIADTGYPPNLATLVDGVDDITSPQGGRKIIFLRRIPRDPMDNDHTKAPDKTWGLRSYSSPPDAPKEGDDVFDVFSMSAETAIDGTRYSEW